MDVVSRAERDSERERVLRTFLIADIRGYTTFTREHGDQAAASLASKFAHLARDAVEARSGRVIELRGDEALAVFEDTAQAVRAALELQAACAEETAEDPLLPLPVGVGIDAGQAVPVEDGFRGAALNLAARLCSKAVAGQVLITASAAAQTGDVEGVAFEDRGSVEAKGFDQPVQLREAISTHVGTVLPREAAPGTGEVAAPSLGALPVELDAMAPLVDREHELHWLRGTWRQARRGRGRLVFLSGPAAMGKTRLAAELAGVVLSGADILYAGSGGAATALGAVALRTAAEATRPTLVVLDDLDVVAEDLSEQLQGSFEAIEERPAMVLALLRDTESVPHLAPVIERADRFGDGFRRLGPLDIQGVEQICRLYVGEDGSEVPLESILRASGGIPGRVHEVVNAWARDEAGRRLRAAAEWLAEGQTRRSADLDFANNLIQLKLGRLYAPDRGGAPSEGADQCPYKGLAPFEEADSRYFYGRERLVGELAARTVGFGLLGVVGASGSGKSSVVMAGLLPSLAAAILPGSERWGRMSLRPGEHPAEALETALASRDPGERLALVVDQFEEVFTQTIDESERAAFIDRLVHLARDTESTVVVLTIRADYTGHCAPYPKLAELLASNLVLVGPMMADELRRAIELPARRVGLRVESALADALVAEVADEPGGLPLLSTALVELWGEREGGWLRMGAYERTGGVRGAVARLAEASFDQLQGEEREASRAVLLRLVGEGEGEAAVRRRVPFDEFDPTPATQAVLARFTQDRLITASEGMVEVAHEALIREWPRLRAWLEEDGQGRQIRSHITQASRHWAERGRDQAELYRGARLSATIDWAARHGRELNELEREFLTTSRQASEREAERQRRTNRRLRGLLAGVAVFLVVALVAGGLALIQRGHARTQATLVREQKAKAEAQARIAQSRELAAVSEAQLDTDPELALLLGIEAAKASPTTEAGEALREAIARAGAGAAQGGRRPSPPEEVQAWSSGAGGALLGELHGHTLILLSASFSPDGNRILTASTDGTARIWNTRSRQTTLILRHTSPAGIKAAACITCPDAGLTSASFSPDGTLVVTTGVDGTAKIWDAETGKLLKVLQAERSGHTYSAAFSPDGKRLVTGHDSLAVIWDVATGKRLNELDGCRLNPGMSCLHIAFSPDGKRIASSTDHASGTLVWDVDSASPGPPSLVQPSLRLETDEGIDEPSLTAFSPDGKRLVTTGPNGTARIWDAVTGHILKSLPLQGATSATAASFSPSGKLLATATEDGTVQIWDSLSGRPLLQINDPSGEVWSVGFSPDGRQLVTAGADGVGRIWDVAGAGASGGQGGPPNSSSFGTHATGTLVVTSVTDGTARIWDSTRGRTVLILRGHTGEVTAARFSASGDRVVTASRDGTARIWDARTGKVERVLHVSSGAVLSAAFSPDGAKVVTASDDGAIRLWSVETGRVVAILRGHTGPVTSALFSPDGRMVVSAGQDRTTRIWNAEGGTALLVLRGDTDRINAAAFSRTGTEVVTASNDGTARIWDARTGRPLVVIKTPGVSVTDATFSPEFSVIVTAEGDGTVRVWDSRTGQSLLILRGGTAQVNTAEFNENGKSVVTSSADGTSRIFACDLCAPIDALLRAAELSVTRQLTPAERQLYLHESG